METVIEGGYMKLREKIRQLIQSTMILSDDGTITTNRILSVIREALPKQKEHNHDRDLDYGCDDCGRNEVLSDIIRLLEEV